MNDLAAVDTKPALPQCVINCVVYDQGGKRYNWHLVIEDGALPNETPGDKTLAVDLGEIHPMAVANEQGEVVIFTG